MKTSPIWITATAIAICAGALGCSSRSKLPVYDPSQVGTVISTEKGEIVAVRDVLIKPSSPAGGSVGSVIGAGAGRSVATGNPAAVGGAVGAVLGSTVGAKADERRGEELTIALEGGQTIIVVQDQSDPPMAPGEKVQVLTSTPAGGSYPGGVWGGRGAPIGFPTGSPTGGNTRVVRDQRFAQVP